MPDLFLHIPKTGGTTFNTALKWVYGPKNCHTIREDRAMNPERWFEATSRAELENFSLVSGHFPFGLGDYLKTGHRYFTILRDPVPRTISRYYQWKLGYPKSKAAQMSLATFGESRQCNLQTGMISGKDVSKDPNQALHLAKKRLLEDFAAFGITERYDESLILIRRNMGWTKLPFYVRGKQTKGKRPGLSEISASTIETIRAANALDVKLYKFATEHFDAMYRSESGIEKEVQKFKRWNAIIERVAPYPLKLYRTVRSYL